MNAPPFEDLRLRDVFRQIERDSIKVLSLDVFDTLVWRQVPEPIDAFILMGHRLKEAGILSGRASADIFAEERRLAEVRARQKLSAAGQGTEVTLREVYEQLPRKLVNAFDFDRLIENELTVEESLLVPDLDIVALSQAVGRQFGVETVLASDTYFSPQHIQRFLDRHASARVPIKAIYTSSTHRTGKSQALFPLILEQLDLRPTQVLHIGDNYNADIEGARASGIQAFYLPRHNEAFEGILRREEEARSNPNREEAAIHPQHGDLGVTALRCRALRRLDGDGLSPEERPFWEFGAGVFGPVFNGFVEWVHRRAGEEGVATVYCIMREGKFLSELINAAGPEFESPVRAEPLWLSRDVCTRAAIIDGSREEFQAFFRRRRPPTLRDICSALRVDPADLASLDIDPDTVLQEQHLVEAVLDSLCAKGPLRDGILERATELRQRLLTYLERQVKPAANGRVVLVDIGWGATIQTFLTRALKAGPLRLRPLGLYLMTNSAAHTRASQGVETEGFLNDGAPTDPLASWVLRSPEILEQTCMPNLGSLVDFDERGQPVLAAPGYSESECAQREALRKGVFSFQGEWLRYRQAFPAAFAPLDYHARALLLSILARAVIRPTLPEARMFAAWSHDENFGSDSAEHIAPAELVPALKYMTPVQFLRLPMQKIYWPFGLATLHDEALAEEAAAIAEKTPPEQLLPTQSEAVALAVDTGSGFEKGKRLVTSVEPHHEGRCFFDETIAAEGIEAIRIEPATHPALVQIDWLRLSLQVQGQAEPLDLHLE
ncbi:MAG TPA: HAD family hydrolase, partial [Dehalococcoidia bacterium]|nr:HAD family hydrolase [Dehalococcoidia bacterium]